MDEYELLVKGGKEGEGLVHGKSADSSIIKRVQLPEDDDEHMPPKARRVSQRTKWCSSSGGSTTVPRRMPS